MVQSEKQRGKTEEYQVFARKYRPQTFGDVLGQEPAVATLKNAILFDRLAHAYLFSGPRGTGKTSLARIFAKALNCQTPADGEPCNQCSSCKEITSGHSLDVLEIDGASHRGIEDIRQINDTVGYASSSGKYKIYIIDEVHMLTKEAFNALLKTLEEPPAKVKFFFATTEPHKVLPTIVSRCQHFSFGRIPEQTIADKLESICKENGAQAEPEALLMLSKKADGGLRDAESLLDQVIAFHDGPLTAQSVSSILGMTSRDTYFGLDQAGHQGDAAAAFDIAHRVFSEGKDLAQFIHGLIEHFRALLIVSLSGKDASQLSLSVAERDQYEASAKLYRSEQCMDLLDFLIDAEQKIRFSPSQKPFLENVLLHVIRSHRRLPLSAIVKRLSELEAKTGNSNTSAPPITHTPAPPPKAPAPKIAAPKPAPIEKKQPPKKAPPAELSKPQHHYDTLLHFAAVELEGSLEKKN